MISDLQGHRLQILSHQRRPCPHRLLEEEFRFRPRVEGSDRDLLRQGEPRPMGRHPSFLRPIQDWGSELP